MKLASLRHASTLALVLAAAAGPTLAQTRTESTVVEEVVVSARKTEEKLRDVPIAATVLDAAQIRDQGGVRTMEDLLANAPGVHFVNTTSPTNSEVTIRGSGTSRGTNAEAAVGLYRNGAYVGGGTAGGRTFSRLDLFDIERAEVLRGTQGALYGRNAVGGAINIITASPKFENSADVFGQYGSKHYTQADLILNGKVSDKVAVRFSGSVVDQDKGFFYNPTKDEYYDAQKSDAERLQVRYADGNFDGVLLAEHYQANLQAVTFQVVIPNGSAAAFPGGYVQEPYRYPHNGPGSAKQQINDVQATWTYKFPGVTLASTSLYRERRTLFAFDGDGVDPAELARIRARNPGSAAATDPNNESVTRDRTKNWYQDVRLSGGVAQARWLAGFEYVKFSSRGDNTTGRTPTAANGQSPGTVAPVELDVKSWAAYGLFGFDLTPTFNLTAEGRYTSDRRSIDINRFDRRTGLPVSTARFDVSGASSPNNFNYTLSAGWKFRPEWLLYGKVGTAFRAGSFNTDLGDPRGRVIPLTYDDEKSTTYEAGLKGNPFPNLFVAATAFHTRTRDALIQQDNGCRATNPACPVAATNFLTNAGTAEVEGIELEATWRTVLPWGGRLRINAGVTNLKGKFVSGPDAGKKVPRLPDTSVKGDINYRQPLVGGFYGFINARFAAEYGGRQEINPDIPIPFTLPNQQFRFAFLRDHEIWDLRAGVSNDRTEIAVYADNATNDHYVLFEAPAANRLNTPRRVGVQVRQRF